MIIALSGKKNTGKDTVAAIIQYLCVQYRPEGSTWTTETLIEHLKKEDDRDWLDNYGWPKKQFAGKLKEFVASITRTSRKELEYEAYKSMLLSEEWKTRTGAIPTRRQLLQRVGELMRREVNLNIWIIGLMADYKISKIKDYIQTRHQAIDLGGKYFIPEIPEVGKEHWGKEIASSTFIHKQVAIKTVEPNWIITDVRFPNEAKAIKDRNGLIFRITRKDVSTSDHESEIALDNYTEFDCIIPNNSDFESLIGKVKMVLERFKIITTNEENRS